MSNEKSRRTPLMNQMLLVLMVAMLIYLVVSFAHQVTISHQQTAELNQLEEKIRISATERAQLEGYLEYLWSSEALDLFGRLFGWTRPDEQLVVPFGMEAEVPPPEPRSLEDVNALGSPQDAWQELFFNTQ
jgi:hypothetical protein